MKYIVLVVMIVVCTAGVALVLRLNDQYQYKRRWDLLRQLGSAMVLYREANRGAWPEDMELINRENESLIDRIEAAYGRRIEDTFSFFPKAQRKNEMVVVDNLNHIAIYGDGHLESLQAAPAAGGK